MPANIARRRVRFANRLELWGNALSFGKLTCMQRRLMSRRSATAVRTRCANETMEYGEFWILESALTACVPFRFVYGPRKFLESQWNKPWHALRLPLLLDTFERLLLSCEIEVLNEKGDVVLLSRTELGEAIATADCGPNAKAYGLTSEGGTRWELFAEPDWSRYHARVWNDDDGDHLEVVAASPKVAERAFQYEVRCHGLRVIPETIERRTLHPWCATYWKTIQFGYSVRSEVEQLECGSHVSEFGRDYEYFHDWYAKHPDTPSMGRIC